MLFYYCAIWIGSTTPKPFYRGGPGRGRGGFQQGPNRPNGPIQFGQNNQPGIMQPGSKFS